VGYTFSTRSSRFKGTSERKLMLDALFLLLTLGLLALSLWYVKRCDEI